MPQFFFDITDGTLTTLDRIGVELDGQDTARAEATRTLTEIAAQELPGDGPSRAFKILVSDAEGKVLFEVQLDFNTVEGEGSNRGEGSDDRH